MDPYLQDLTSEPIGGVVPSYPTDPTTLPLDVLPINLSVNQGSLAAAEAATQPIFVYNNPATPTPVIRSTTYAASGQTPGFPWGLIIGAGAALLIWKKMQKRR